MLERIVIMFVGLFVVCQAAPAAGQPGPFPPWYDVIPVASSPEIEGRPRINNRRQVVFEALRGSDLNTTEIYVFDPNTGLTTQITHNSLRDTLADINDQGAMTWVRRFGNPLDANNAEIILRTPEGVEVRLTDNNLADYTGGFNNLGQIAWERWFPRGCVNAAKNVMFFDGQATHEITDDDLGNSNVHLNDVADIVWIDIDLCLSNPDGDIKLYRDENILTLTHPRIQSGSPRVNNRGSVVWYFIDPFTGERGLRLWENGRTTLLLSDRVDPGTNPTINNRGEIAFNRWQSQNGTWQIWLYSGGRFWQVTDTPPIWNTNPRMNELGDIVWDRATAPPSNRDVWMALKRYGDLNCDGVVDAFDIDPFVDALFSPAEYTVRFPDCDGTLADVNFDLSVNAFDIEPFIEMLFP